MGGGEQCSKQTAAQASFMNIRWKCDDYIGNHLAADANVLRRLFK